MNLNYIEEDEERKKEKALRKVKQIFLLRF